MPELKEFYFPSSTGKNQVYARMWYPSDGNIKGTVQIAHGIAEIINRYDDFAKFLAENGYVVIGNDHLGHGKTMGNKSNQGFFAEENGWAYVVADMKSLYNQVKYMYPDVPHILFGHSMGSFLARTYIIKYPLDFNATVLSGTGNQARAVVKIGYNIAQSTVNKNGPEFVSQKIADLSMGGYNKGFDAQPGETAWLTRDKEAVKKYDADPECGFTATCSLYRDMFGGILFVSDPENISKVNKDMPILLMSGSDDPVGEKGKGPTKAYKAYQKAGVKDVSLVLYPGGRHEMLNEINHEQVYNDVLDWMNSKI